MLGGVNQLLVLCLRLSYGFLYSGEKKTAVIMSLLLPTLIHILYYSTGFLHFTWKSSGLCDLGGHGDQVNLTNERLKSFNFLALKL